MKVRSFLFLNIVLAFSNARTENWLNIVGWYGSKAILLAAFMVV
jgi:hypothetical protein